MIRFISRILRVAVTVISSRLFFNSFKRKRRGSYQLRTLNLLFLPATKYGKENYFHELFYQI